MWRIVNNDAPRKEFQFSMKLAINYSPHAIDLHISQRINVDLFKCPDWSDLIEDLQDKCALYVHFGLIAGRGGLDDERLDQIEGLLDKTGTRYVNTHLGPALSTVEGVPLESREPRDIERIVQATLCDIRPLTGRFGSDRVILENMPWSPSPPYQVLVGAIIPETISRIVNESGCGLLLDIAHVLIAAKHLQMDAREYLGMLPIDCLRDLHVAGLHRRDDNSWIDHYPMREEDWELCEWVLENIRAGRWPQPETVTLEYGGIGPAYEFRTEPELIVRDVSRLSELMK